MAEQAYGDQGQAASLGERLRRAREAKGLSLDDVASETRIPIRHLQSIEREDWDALPAVTYCIGFVRAYAGAVGEDSSEYGREVRERLGGFRTRAAAPEYFQPADPSRVPPRSVALIAALIAIALVIGYLVWRSSLDEDEAVVAASEGPVAETPVTPAPTQPTSSAATPAAGQPVTIAATEEAWVRIEDAATDTTLFQGILTAGQRFPVPATAQRPVIRTARPQVLRLVLGSRDLGPIEPVERTVSNVSLRAEDLATRLAPASAPMVQAPAPTR